MPSERRLVRIDDFPHGDKQHVTTDFRPKMAVLLGILEEYKINYLLGVSPMLLQPGDTDFLNEHVKQGSVCFHGFDHGFNVSLPWKRIEECWVTGGEFSGVSTSDILSLHKNLLPTMQAINRFDAGHLIPPFNAFNQNLLDALPGMGISNIYTCDKEWVMYNQKGLTYPNGTVIHISRMGLSYDFADFVATNYDKLQENEVITLHWVYDIVKRGDNVTDIYRTLCEKIVNEGNN